MHYLTCLTRIVSKGTNVPDYQHFRFTRSAKYINSDPLKPDIDDYETIGPNVIDIDPSLSGEEKCSWFPKWSKNLKNL